jgi:hypothetical protein
VESRSRPRSQHDPRLGAAAVVTLLEPKELALLRVESLGEEVLRRNMLWFHLPIVDVLTPDEHFEQAWDVAGEELRSILRGGSNVLVHCRGGLRRAGTRHRKRCAFHRPGCGVITIRFLEKMMQRSNVSHHVRGEISSANLLPVSRRTHSCMTRSGNCAVWGVQSVSRIAATSAQLRN